MSESFQLLGLPCSSNLFFPFHFHPYLFCISAFAQNGEIAISKSHSCDDLWKMPDAISWNCLGTRGFLMGMTRCTRSKTILTDYLYNMVRYQRPDWSGPLKVMTSSSTRQSLNGFDDENSVNITAQWLQSPYKI